MPPPSRPHSLTACPHSPRCPPAGGHAHGVPRLAQASIPPRRCRLVPVMRGRLHQALLRSFRIPNPDERFPARRGGGSAAFPFEFCVELGAEDPKSTRLNSTLTWNTYF